ncbi:MAG: 30S ribosomal protein S20 [Deltaproteobacteria bacterium]|nr:30S ribosomal protein S20 [Deltaproteobacteria bacterium]
MANHKSALKRARQTIIRRERNKSNKTQMKNAIKVVRSAIDDGDQAKASSLLSMANSIIFKTASKGTIHKRTASRKVSRLAKAANSLKA